MKKGWNTFGALLIAIGFFLCLMFAKLNLALALHGNASFSYAGSTEGALITFLAAAIAWFAVRDGQRWAWWSLLIAFLTIAVMRIAVDRSCTVRIFWQHGCHQFMLGLLIGAVGFVLTRD